MNTTNKEFKNQVQAHIIDCLSEDETSVLTEQLFNVVVSFRKWYCPYERKLTPNRYEAFQKWLTGLPSVLSIEFEYYTVNQTLKKWFENCGMEFKERDGDKEFHTYLHLISREFEKLCKKNKVQTPFY